MPDLASPPASEDPARRPWEPPALEVIDLGLNTSVMGASIYNPVDSKPYGFFEQGPS